MNKEVFKEIYLSFFFLGRAPIAPGTFGTLGSALLAFLVTYYLGSNAGYALLILIPIMYYFGLILAPWAEKKYGGDPGIYVLDEVIGMGIAISGVYIYTRIFDQFSFNFIESISAVGELFILTFVFFRFFDISKIGPVGWIENNQQEKAYIRVVGDDIMAAILSIIVVIFLLSVNLYVMQ